MDLFCNANCKEGYQTDRRYGLIYSSWLVQVERVPENVQTWPANRDGFVLVGWEDGSRLNESCAYCGADLCKGGHND